MIEQNAGQGVSELSSSRVVGCGSVRVWRLVVWLLAKDTQMRACGGMVQGSGLLRWLLVSKATSQHPPSRVPLSSSNICVAILCLCVRVVCDGNNVLAVRKPGLANHNTEQNNKMDDLRLSPKNRKWTILS